MGKDKIITFRVSDELAARVKRTTEILKINVAKFLTNQIDAYYNPPAVPEPVIEYKDRIVEVEKFVDREVIKEVRIDSEGTVQGHTITLSDALYEELNKLKYNPDASLDAFVGDICWNRIHWSQKKRSPATAQTNGTFPTTTVSGNATTEISRFDYWNKRIADCDEHDYDEQEKIYKGVMEETQITEKQRQLLKRGGTLKNKL